MFIRGTGKQIKKMASVLTAGQMAEFTKETGKQAGNMEKEL